MRKIIVLTVVALGAVPLLAAPADQVRTRVTAYRSLGAAYKVVSDAIRSGQVQTPQVRQATGQINLFARQQYGLFPAGSGPRPGVKTDALATIWSRAGEFRGAQDAFARQASTLQQAIARGDANAIRIEGRKLGATCKGCHDRFRAETD